MLRIGSVALGFFGAAALFGVEEAESSQNARRSTARNSYFEIVADDSASAQFAGAVGEMLAKRVSRFMQIPSSAKRPIFVDLQPFSRFSGATQFETEMYPNGNVKLLIAWGETTDRAILERALAQGFLTILASSYGEDRLVVPLWLELAVQQLARVSAVSSHRWALAERVKEGEPMSLREILSAERGMDREEELGAQAFWLIHFLESEARGRGQLEGFIVRLFRGEDPLEALEASFGGRFRERDEAELWWLVGRSEMVGGSNSPVWSVNRSRDRVLELARLTFFADGERRRLFVDDLWGYWQSASLADELRHRSRVIGIERAFVHVFYQNAILSLNHVFSSILEGDEEGYREARRAFQRDLRAGDELAKETGDLLDDLQAELEGRKD